MKIVFQIVHVVEIRRTGTLHPGVEPVRSTWNLPYEYFCECTSVDKIAIFTGPCNVREKQSQVVAAACSPGNFDSTAVQKNPLFLLQQLQCNFHIRTCLSAENCGQFRGQSLGCRLTGTRVQGWMQGFLPPPPHTHTLKICTREAQIVTMPFFQNFF